MSLIIPQVTQQTLVVTYAPYSAGIQSAHTTLIVTEAVFASRIGALYELALLSVEASGEDDPLAAHAIQAIQETLISVAPAKPDPIFVLQVAQTQLVEDKPSPARGTGSTNATLIQTDPAVPDPIRVLGVDHLTLVKELSGSIVPQATHQALVVTEEAQNGTIVNQNGQVTLLLSQGPTNDTRTIGAYHLALHVDISGITTSTSLVGATQIVLVQAPGDVPTPDPTRNRQELMTVVLGASLKYQFGVQSKSSEAAVYAPIAIRKAFSLNIQSQSIVRGSAEQVAKVSGYTDPGQIGSYVFASRVISATAMGVTKPTPISVHSMSVMKKSFQQVVFPVQKPNPNTITSSLRVLTMTEQTSMYKSYGPAMISSTAHVFGNVMSVLVHKDLTEVVQSKSITKKMSRLVSRTAQYQDLATIRSTVMARTTSRSASVAVKYQDPDTIRPILSLSSMTQLFARSITMKEPSVEKSPLTAYAVSQSHVLSKGYKPPDEISKETALVTTLIQLTAVPAVYDQPELVEIIRREVYGTYYSELDQN